MKAVYVFLLLILSILLGSPSQSNASTIYRSFYDVGPQNLTYQEVLDLLPPGDRVAYEDEVRDFYTGLLKPYYWEVSGVSRDHPASDGGLRVDGYETPWSPTGGLTPLVWYHGTFIGFISGNWPSEFGWFIELFGFASWRSGS